MLGYATIADALQARPSEMTSVSPETWELLRLAYDGGARGTEFDSAWENGRAFAQSSDGLRLRRPLTIEWKGSHRAPGDEVAPIDLRIDHVFLVSWKYLSRITINASPAHLFERLLQGGHGVREADWFASVAADEYQALYESARSELGRGQLPARVTDLNAGERRAISQILRGEWSAATNLVYQRFVDAVASETARRWKECANSPQQLESIFWRLLRMGSAPYFVLGASPTAPLRLRIATPWDWRLRFRLRQFEIIPQAGGQPRVGWRARVEDRHSGELRDVPGHVEIRWSHGRFSGNPEAKVYLDVPHDEVPGYFALR